jgi:hypothetical protein
MFDSVIQISDIFVHIYHTKALESTAQKRREINGSLFFSSLLPAVSGRLAYIRRLALLPSSTNALLANEVCVSGTG